MSATNRGAVRVENDFYGTPAWATYAILNKLRLPLNARILEPGCGDGAILDELARCGYTNRYGCELDLLRANRAMAKGRVRHLDFLDASRAPMPNLPWSFDATIGNPPYSLAMEFVQRAMLYAPCVVMLLRLNWLSSAKRAAWHKTHPAHVHVLESRPSFCVSVTCKKKCGWHASYAPGAWHPNVCQSDTCSAKVSVVTTDATEYAWFQWGGPGYVPGRWEILST